MVKARTFGEMLRHWRKSSSYYTDGSLSYCVIRITVFFRVEMVFSEGILYASIVIHGYWIDKGTHIHTKMMKYNAEQVRRRARRKQRHFISLGNYRWLWKFNTCGTRAHDVICVRESVSLQALKWYYKKFFLFLSFSFSLSLCFYFFCNSLYLLCSLLSFQFQYFQFFSSYLPWKMSIPSLRNCLPIISAQFFSQWKHISRTFLRLRFTFHSYCHTLYEFGVSFIFFSNSASARQEKQKVSRKKQEERERGKSERVVRK